jgi:hypothetical protein
MDCPASSELFVIDKTEEKKKEKVKFELPLLVLGNLVGH